LRNGDTASVTVTAGTVPAGTLQLDASVDSDFTDAVTTNNAVTLTALVAAPPASGGGGNGGAGGGTSGGKGGGGSMSWLDLLGLVLMAGSAARAARRYFASNPT
jgi:hypothetical protein